MSYTFSEIVHAVWLPILSGLLTAGATWLVWFYSTAHCTPANAAVLMCEVTPLGRYLTATVWHDCIIHAGIVMTLTGGSDIMLFLRERRHSAALAEQLKASEEARQFADQRAEQRIAEERQMAAEERRLAAEERQRADADRQRAEQRAEQRIAEERRLAAEERQRADADRQRAEQRIAEQHQTMLELMAKFADAIDRNRNGHTPPQS